MSALRKEDTKKPDARQQWIDEGEFRLVFDKVPPTMNRMLNQHWAEYQHEKKGWVDRVLAEMGPWSGAPIKGRVHVHYDRGFCGIGADYDNAAASVKFLLDAIVKLGVVEDDNPEYISGLTISQTRYAKRKDVRAILILEPVNMVV